MMRNAMLPEDVAHQGELHRRLAAAFFTDDPSPHASDAEERASLVPIPHHNDDEAP